jgi:Zn-dependent protease
MFSSWSLGRVAGIDLFLHPTFLLLLAFAFAYQGGAIGALFLVAVFGCVLLHELGHALTARAFGIGTRRITLSPIGGVAQLERMPRSPGAELLITLAGPAVNLAIALGLGLILDSARLLDPYSDLSTAGQFVALLQTVNLALAAFNMIPAFPMDGGRILRALLAGWLGRLRATEIAAVLGQALALIFPLVMILLDRFSILHVVLAGFVYFAAAAERAGVRAEERARLRSGRRGSGAFGPEVWFAPSGYTWERRGAGVWQLVPVAVPVDPGQGVFWRDSDATHGG